MGKFLNFLFGRKSAKRYTIDFANKDIPIKSPSTSSLKEYIFNDPDLASNIRRFVDNVLIEAPKLVKTDDSSLSDKTVRQYHWDITITCIIQYMIMLLVLTNQYII